MLGDADKTRRRCGGCTSRSFADAEGTLLKLTLHACLVAVRRSRAGVRAWIAGHQHDECGDCERGMESSFHSFP